MKIPENPSYPREGIARRLTHDISDYSEDLSLTSDGLAASTVSTVESQIWVFPSLDRAKGRQIPSGEPRQPKAILIQIDQ